MDKRCEVCEDGQAVARFVCEDGNLDVCEACEQAILLPENLEEVAARRIA